MSKPIKRVDNTQEGERCVVCSFLLSEGGITMILSFYLLGMAILFLVLSISMFIIDRDKRISNLLILLATIVQFAIFFWHRTYL